MVLNLSGQHAGAIEHFAAAVKYQPNYLEARLALADALRSTGRLQESLAQFARIVELDPSLAEAWVMYARTLVVLKRYREARDRLNEARRTHPGDPELTDLLVRLLAAAPDDRLRDGRQAMALMEELLKSSPPIDVREPMAMTLAELGQFEEAVPGTLVKLPARMTSSVRSRKNPSTKFIQELDVGVKCITRRSRP